MLDAAAGALLLREAIPTHFIVVSPDEQSVACMAGGTTLRMQRRAIGDERCYAVGNVNMLSLRWLP